MNAGGRAGPGGGVARMVDVVGQVQALGLASAAAVAERYVGTVDRYLAERAATTGRWEGWGQRTPADPDQEVLVIPGVTAGTLSQASLWVHSSSAPAVVAVRAGPLTSPDGQVLTPAVEAADAWGRPNRAGTTGPGSTAGAACEVDVAPDRPAEVRLLVAVPPGTAPGHFHGVVTCTGAPHRALPVSLEVLGSREAGT